MSFILNALKKSEEERQTVQSDPVQDRIPDRDDVIKKKKTFMVNYSIFG